MISGENPISINQTKRRKVAANLKNSNFPPNDHIWSKL